MTRVLRIAVLLAAVFAVPALSGCRHTPPAPTAPKHTKADMKYQAIYVEPFTVAAAGVKEEDPKPHVAAAQASCLGALTNSGLFDTVKLASPGDPKAGALIVKAELVSLRIVGGGARFWLGAMAGSSDMKFEVTLVDASTGANVGRSVVGADSNAFGGAWSMGATDRSLPGQVGAHVAEAVAFGAKK